MKSELIVHKLLDDSGFGNNHEISEIFIDLTQDGFFQFSTVFHLCANSIKSLHIGQAAFNQSQLILVSDQSVFHAQTTVVICGVYHIVHKLFGNIYFFQFFVYCLVDVPVFAATGLLFKLT
jgi:hypothetical protein